MWSQLRGETVREREFPRHFLPYEKAFRPVVTSGVDELEILIANSSLLTPNF
ncbi:hypothetical protein I8752_23210 [Nostocaceae cyanobacterium CENA369]|uniref:Uncharacterized protein n=1 Tax=Dendronalium phyllosphericum CENA369 TaxID=1725256 RepID=A0A8J7IAE4_9NOST|nr:hypothetical protein [Dendronalium phyllosphericum]MBH8575855.1 hypothetical protein [Dendronalium phyllosphericum CENA369]